jgi:AmmeMemoRadiSam system protein B
MQSSKIIKRMPAVAGMFYPASAEELRSDVEQMLRSAKTSEPAPKAIIAPHAGYIYSGSVAAKAYARLASVKNQINRVVLLGPSHRVPLLGLAASSADFFTTPLGDIEIDRAAIDSILELPQVAQFDAAHEQEHSLEVHLPFLQVALENFKLVPIVVGDTEPAEVAEVMQKLWGGNETLIVVSSDLSHFHDYATAKQLDQSTSDAIENLQPENIFYENACGRNPVNGLLYLAKKIGLHAETIDLRNSGDTAGTKDRVVGYGAYVFH